MRAVEKLSEAGYFLDKMRNESATDGYRYCLSAFLTSARSVMDFSLQSARDHGNQAWYDRTVSGQPDLQFLKLARDANVHKKLIKPQKNSEVAIQVNLTPRTTPSVWVGERNQAPQETTLNENQPTGDAPRAEVREWFEFAERPGEDATQVCSQILLALGLLISGGHNLGVFEGPR